MADARDLSSLPIARSLVELLQKNGFRSVLDLKGIQPLDLAEEIEVSPEVAVSIIKNASSSFMHASGETPNEAQRPVSAKDILLKATESTPIITLSKSIDTMLGGGIQVGQITEFCGVPGIGKTQLGMQLVLTAQIPQQLGGNAGEALYIDTEGSFTAERLEEMAEELSNQLKKIYEKERWKQKQNEKEKKKINEMDEDTFVRFISKESLLGRVHVFRTHDQAETIATINHLDAFVKQSPAVKLIVIDSVAFHFRESLADTSARSRLLSNISQTLNQLAFTHRLAVVLTNHVTNRFGSGPPGTNDEPHMAVLQRITPALGEMWSHCVTNRVMLHWEANPGGSADAYADHEGTSIRVATLVKSPGMPTAAAPYRVTKKGIRDTESDERKRKYSAHTGEALTQAQQTSQTTQGV